MDRNLQARWSRFEDRFEAATAMRDSGQSSDALELLGGLVAEDPAFFPGWLIIGGIHFKVRNYADALHAFDRVVAEAPRHEMASVARFHCLWNLGEEKRAVAEMRRLLSLRDSSEYRRLAEEMPEVLEIYSEGE